MLLDSTTEKQLREIPLVAALYVRLSKEDRHKVNKGDDSESIVNQQAMLIDYCKNKEWIVYDIYNDEDFSGSDRDRPDFNRMINDARDHKFDVILCKTQSRFARDMEIVEKYINGLFPVWGIRFISIVDNNDSTNKANRKSRQINSLIDQWYLEDLSDNIRATLASKRKQGLWVGAFAPYGYIKDPKNKNHLIIDDEAAEVVRYVFSLYLKGYGITTIARRLNEERIPNPATYKQQHGQPFQNAHRTCSDMWHTYSIQRMISNELYIGNTVQGIQENISYKSNKKRYKPKEEWDIVEGTHDAIIDMDTWDKVQHLREQKLKCGKSGIPNLFAKKVICLKCGGSMRVYYCQHMRYYRCNASYFDQRRCSGTYISEKVLHQKVIEQIRQLSSSYIQDKELKDKIEILSGLQQKQIELRQSLIEHQQELDKINDFLQEIYLDKLNKVLDVQEYVMYKRKYNTKRVQYETEVYNINAELKQVEKKLLDNSSRAKLLEKYQTIQKLDTEVVNTLIDYVEIGGTKYNRIVNIYWNF